ncbi:MAG: peptidylprolyl isomerase [Chthoniobacterales bacterium]
MKRSILLLRTALVLLLPAPLALALTIKPNVPPVVSGPIGDRQQYNDATAIIDLAPFFRDPDASAAVQLTTPSGVMNFTLDGEQAPITVANFLRYLDEGRYFRFDPIANATASTFFHRSVPGFVIQAGGFVGTENPSSPGSAQPTAVLTFPSIQNEPFISNQRATIAMAKLGSDQNSATSQWFINLADNSANLDTQNGGFTVFGRVAGAGMATADAIAALPRFNFGGSFNELPLRDYTSPNPVRVPNLVSIPAISRISPLTYSASTNNLAALGARISGTHLLVNALQSGAAQVTVTATDLDGVSVAQNFNVNLTAAPGRLRNISTRVNFPTGNEVLIGGFIIGAGSAKRLAVRAIGPSLGGPGGLANPLANPTLEFRNASEALIASNDNWGDSPDRQLLTDIGLAPTAANESALIITVPASAQISSYTAIVRSSGNTPGVGLVEVYDLDSAVGGSTLLNLSTRGEVGTGNNVMIGGFITGGTDPRRLIVRALGPSLADFGVAGSLADPTLELRNAQGMVVDSNTDWQSHPNAGEIQTAGVAPTRALESALITTVPSGAYTAVVAGNGSQPTGVALVEIFQVQ